LNCEINHIVSQQISDIFHDNSNNNCAQKSQYHTGWATAHI